MQLDLVDGGADRAGGEDVAQQREVEVADADALHEAGALEFFHGAPGVGVGHGDGLHRRRGGGRIVKPFRRVTHVERDVGEGDGKVDEVEIEHVELQVAQGALAGSADVLGLVVGVPKFRSDPELVAAAETVAEGGGDPGTDLGLVAVVAGAVEVAVAEADRLVDEAGEGGLGHFPHAQTDGGERAAVGKREAGRRGNGGHRVRS